MRFAKEYNMKNVAMSVCSSLLLSLILNSIVIKPAVHANRAKNLDDKNQESKEHLKAMTHAIQKSRQKELENDGLIIERVLYGHLELLPWFEGEEPEPVRLKDKDEV